MNLSPVESQAYIAPANGYFRWSTPTTSTGFSGMLRTGGGINLHCYSVAGYSSRGFVIAKKGDSFTLNFSGKTVDILHFIYADGEV